MDVLIADVIGEVALVLIASSLLGALAVRLRQPRVIGQILAGVLLGPTLLGQFPGHLTSHLFPKATLPSMTVLANVAVVIFMFVVGYELDLRPLRRSRKAAPLVAGGALLVPMALGIAAVYVFKSGFVSLGEPSHLSRSFVMFMAVAVSITALPVLASIVRERGLAGTQAGVTATAAAGAMDVLAWLVLAAALVGTVQSSRPLWLTIVLLVAFVAGMLAIVRPLLRWWMRSNRSLMANQLPVAIVLALGSAWVTGTLGLHPVFGGFLAGLAMPSLNGGPDADVLRPMEQVGNLLLPLFFVVTGLSLDVGSLGGQAFLLLLVICVIASVGKLGPAYAGSRLAGLKPRESAGVAALVNTRGLTELIALNVGLTDGIIDRKLFSILVIMALIMTVATGPLLSWIRLPVPASEQPGPAPATSTPATATEE